MSRALTNKQLAVLAAVRERGEITAKEVADELTDRDAEPRRYFSYADAYVALKRLRKVGLVGRRCRRDEWGDELATHIYYPISQPDPDDPLEQAWNLPTAPSAPKVGS